MSEGDDGAEGTAAVDELLEELESLEASVQTPDERRRVRRATEAARRLDRPITPAVFGRVVKGFGRGDVAEALLGSVLFGIPMLVEDGTLDVGRFVASHPAFLGGTLLFTVGLVIGIIYVADIQDVRITNPILGVIPRRLVGVLGTSFLTALVGMTVWGRADWAEPVVAFAQVTVAFVPMAIGAALGDILPGT